MNVLHLLGMYRDDGIGVVAELCKALSGKGILVGIGSYEFRKTLPPSIEAIQLDWSMKTKPWKLAFDDWDVLHVHQSSCTAAILGLLSISLSSCCIQLSDRILVSLFKRTT
jgi:hypothetical protein